MSKDPKDTPELLSGDRGEEQPAALRTGFAPDHGADDPHAIRGQPAPQAGSGGVQGGGAGAGGGGGPEDYDSDAAGGGGDFKFAKMRPMPDEGGDASQHGSR